MYDASRRHSGMSYGQQASGQFNVQRYQMQQQQQQQQQQHGRVGPQMALNHGSGFNPQVIHNNYNCQIFVVTNIVRVQN